MGGEWRRLQRRVDWRLLLTRCIAMSDLGSQRVEAIVQRIHMVLKHRNLIRHVLVLLGVLEAIAAIRCIYALEVQITTPLAGCLAVALDFASLAFVAGKSLLVSNCVYQHASCAIPCDRDISVAPGPLLSSSSAIFGLPLQASIRVLGFLGGLLLKLMRKAGNGLDVVVHGGQSSALMEWVSGKARNISVRNVDPSGGRSGGRSSSRREAIASNIHSLF